MIERTEYLKRLSSFKDKKVIKVITGIRRCGKSTLLQQYTELLKNQGISNDRIIFVNLESARYDAIRDYHELYTLIESNIKSEGKHYIFIDEVQNVASFEKAVESLSIDFDTDIYITGSNAYMLSSELSTLLSGRYVEIFVQPLSFKEYYSVWQDYDKEKIFYQYMKYGGFPFLAKETDEMIINNYLDGIYSTIFVKDIVKHNRVKDITGLENLLKTVFSSIGGLISATSLSKELKSSGRTATNETVEKYLEMFCKAYIVKCAARYNIREKTYLKTLSKYYVCDLGLRNNVLGYRQMDVSHALENIVYLELIRRGYKVDIGKVNETEIDFVARKQDCIEYYQVSFTVNNSADTLNREIKPFASVNDHYQKFLITMDKDFVSDIDGIRKLYAVDWLLRG